MKIIHIQKEMQAAAPCVATIGFFDGVHRGHQYLIRQVTDAARGMGLQSTVITFDAHPRKVLQQYYQPQMLTTLDEKLSLLAKTGVDATAVLHFDQEMADLSAHDFMKIVLHDRLQVRKLIIGYDNRFGRHREEGFEDYVRYGKELGIEVVQAKAFSLNGIHVSSSVVRSLLQEGEVELAHQCLGYPYTLVGKVVAGYHEGRKLGFPTANLDPSTWGKLVPGPGVYAVKVRVEKTLTLWRGMMNIGTRPTFDGTKESLEVNLFNFEENIYGKVILVSFIHRVRTEKKFNTPEELAAQLKEDQETIERLFEQDAEE